MDGSQHKEFLTPKIRVWKSEFLIFSNRIFIIFLQCTWYAHLLLKCFDCDPWQKHIIDWIWKMQEWRIFVIMHIGRVHMISTVTTNYNQLLHIHHFSSSAVLKTCAPIFFNFMLPLLSQMKPWLSNHCKKSLSCWKSLFTIPRKFWEFFMIPQVLVQLLGQKLEVKWFLRNCKTNQKAKVGGEVFMFFCIIQKLEHKTAYYYSLQTSKLEKVTPDPF